MLVMSVVIVVIVVLCSVVGWIRRKPATLGHMINDAIINHSAECGCGVCLEPDHIVTDSSPWEQANGCSSEWCWTCNNRPKVLDED
jgi:hypothetical protein